MITENSPATRLRNAIGFKPKKQITPVSNTGVKMTEDKIAPVLEVGIDWISGSIKETRFDELIAELEMFFSDEFVNQNRSAGFYQETFKSALGILAARTPHGIGRTDCYFSIPGSVIGATEISKTHELINILIYKYDFHFTRLDLKLDDYSKIVSPELAYEAYQRGQVSGFRAHHWHSSGSNSSEIGTNLVLGRRGKNGGGKCMRIYDKNAESKGAINATRIEAELSGDFAKDAATLLCSVPVEQIADVIFRTIIGLVDFVEKNKSKRLDRSVRLRWWDEIVNAREKIKLSQIRIKSTLDGVKRWIHNQVSAGLATILSSYEDKEEDWDDWLHDVIINGKAKMRERHNALVNVDRMLKAMAN